MGHLLMGHPHLHMWHPPLGIGRPLLGMGHLLTLMEFPQNLPTNHLIMEDSAMKASSTFVQNRLVFIVYLFTVKNSNTIQIQNIVFYT